MPPIARYLALILLAAPLTAVNAQPYPASPGAHEPSHMTGIPAGYGQPVERAIHPPVGPPRRNSVVATEHQLSASEAYGQTSGRPAAGEPSAQSPSSQVPTLSRPAGARPLPKLSPPSPTKGSARPKETALSSIITVASSLAVVLGLFLVVASLMRRAAPGGSSVLPADVVDVLGRRSLGNRNQVQLVRCGSKLLLVSVTPTGAETLTEITEPDEVTRLSGLCRQSKPGSASQAFREVFQQLASQRKSEVMDA